MLNKYQKLNIIGSYFLSYFKRYFCGNRSQNYALIQNEPYALWASLWNGILMISVASQLIYYSYELMGLQAPNSLCNESPFQTTLQWRHNVRDDLSNYQCLHCLFRRLFRRRSKKTSKLRVTGLCEGNRPETGSFPHKGPVSGKCFQLMTSSCPVHGGLILASSWSPESHECCASFPENTMIHWCRVTYICYSNLGHHMNVNGRYWW